jgi:N-acetylmuramic acid 6-phosphate etherase
MTDETDAEKLDTLATESVYAADLADLDLRPLSDTLALLVDTQGAASTAVRKAVPQLTAVAEEVAKRLDKGGRLFYVGAGTSGRLAVLDAVECVPTFNTPPELVVGIIAGGHKALTLAVEGIEDDTAAGASDLRSHALQTNDTVIGISASGRTPYVLGALGYARDVGAYTAVIVNNLHSAMAKHADDRIELLTGAEVISGSTRMTAGTAQKIALNALSTAVMVRIGKTYGPYMVDLRATNAKLRQRAVRIVRQITGAQEQAATQALQTADGRVKVAVITVLLGCSVEEAERRLQQADGRVRGALTAG